MRLFIAVHPSPAALDHLAEAVGRLRLGAAAAGGASVGLSARERWHVTLAFLGELADDRAGAAADAMAAGVTRWRDAARPAPRLRLAGGGRFGRRRFTVLWAGLEGDLEELRRLARELRRALRQAKLPCDDRKPFRPHLTFARPGERLPADDLRSDLDTLAGYEGPWWRVESAWLVRSRPGPQPRHEPIAATSLAG